MQNNPVSEELVKAFARIVRVYHWTIVRQGRRTNEPRKTFHQGDKDAARAILTSPAYQAELQAAYLRGMAEAAGWHDARAVETPDVFEQELHEISAAAIRYVSTNPRASAYEVLDAAQAIRSRMEEKS